MLMRARNKLKAVLLICLVVLGILMPGILEAQQVDLQHFDALRSYGKIPEDILNSIKKVESDYKSGGKDNGTKNAKQTEEKFRVMSNYYMNELLLSGNVVFGDPIGTYVNKVADSLLAGFPELRKQIRIYITRSEYGNAYSTDEGVIFINVGLIARLKNEAQLAYIISHELVHYVKKHNITIYQENEKAMRRKTEEYSDRDLSQRLMQVNFRSKEIEMLADREGLRNYFAKSNYAVDEAEGVFDILLYSSYPFTNEPFDLSPLETKDMIFPDYYLIDDVERLKVDENEADSMSTHPNVRKRKEGIRVMLDSIEEYGTQKYLNSEQEFHQVVDMARFEVIRLLLVEHHFVDALFCAGDMLHTYPDNLFLRKAYASALYGLVSYKENSAFYDVVDNYRQVNGEMAQVNYMMSKLSKRDLIIIALNYTWRVHRIAPEDTYLTAITRELFADLVNNNSAKFDWFYTKNLKELRAEQALKQKQAEVPDTVSNRYRKKHTRESKIDTVFTRFAFVDLLRDSSFVQEFKYFESKSDSITSSRYHSESNHSLPGSAAGGRKKAGSIKRFVMCEPYIVKVDKRKKDQVVYRDSEVNAARIKATTENCAEKLGLNMYLADAVGITENDVQAFNEMSFANEFVSERFHQEEEGIMLSYCSQFIDTLMKNQNSDYLAWMATTGVVKRKPIFKLSLMSLLPYLWPYTIYQFCVPKVHTSYYYIMFNVKTGRISFASIVRVRADIHEDQMNSHIYDFMNKTKHYHEK
jgi:hypothetical protein